MGSAVGTAIAKGVAVGYGKVACACFSFEQPINVRQNINKNTTRLGYFLCIISMHLIRQLLEKLLHHPVALDGDGAGGGGVQAVFQLAQLEQVLVVGAVRLAGEGLAGGQELGGRLSIGRAGVGEGIPHGADHADRADGVKLVGVEQDFGLQGGGGLAVVAEAVSADAVLHRGDARCGPALGGQDLTGKIGGGVVVSLAMVFAGRLAVILSVVEQDRGLDDLQVGAFGLGDPGSQAGHALDVVEAMDGVIRVPGTGLGEGGHASIRYQARLM